MVQEWWNHWKTIDGNGALEKKHYHPIVTKKWPPLKSTWTGHHPTIQPRHCWPKAGMCLVMIMVMMIMITRTMLHGPWWQCGCYWLWWCRWPMGAPGWILCSWTLASLFKVTRVPVTLENIIIINISTTITITITIIIIYLTNITSLMRINI